MGKGGLSLFGPRGKIMRMPLRSALLGSAVLFAASANAQVATMETLPEFVDRQTRIVDVRGLPHVQAMVRTMSGDTAPDTQIDRVVLNSALPGIGDGDDAEFLFAEPINLEAPIYERSVHIFDLNGLSLATETGTLTIFGANGEIIVLGQLPELDSVFTGQSTMGRVRLDDSKVFVRADRIATGRYAGDIRVILSGRPDRMEAIAADNSAVTISYASVGADALYFDKVFRAPAPFSDEQMTGRTVNLSSSLLGLDGTELDFTSRDFAYEDAKLPELEFVRGFVDSRNRVRWMGQASVPFGNQLILQGEVRNVDITRQYLDERDFDPRFRMTVFSTTLEQQPVEGAEYVAQVLTQASDADRPTETLLSIRTDAREGYTAAADRVGVTCESQAALANLNQLRDGRWQLSIGVLSDTSRKGSEGEIVPSLVVAEIFSRDGGVPDLVSFEEGFALDADELTGYTSKVGDTLLESELSAPADVVVRGEVLGVDQTQTGSIPKSDIYMLSNDFEQRFSAVDTDTASRFVKIAMRSLGLNARRFSSVVDDPALQVNPFCNNGPGGPGDPGDPGPQL